MSLLTFTQPGTKYDISGKWYAYNANGDRKWNLDFTVFYNEDTEAYYAQYNERYVEVSTDGILHFDEEHSNAIKATTKLSFVSDSSFTFSKDGSMLLWMLKINVGDINHILIFFHVLAHYVIFHKKTN